MTEARIIKKYTLNLIGLLGGLGFVGWSLYTSLTSNQWMLSEMLFGAIITLLSAAFLLHNLGAYLYINNERIVGKYHYFGRIDCPVSEVEFVLAGTNTLTLQQTNGKRRTISGVQNSQELCSALRRSMAFDATRNPAALMAELEGLRSAQKRSTVGVFAGVAAMFINLFLTAFLTGERELYEFSQMDWMIMAVMGVVEIVTVVATFRFARAMGGGSFSIQKQEYAIRRTVIEIKPLLHGIVLGVFADEDFYARVTLFGYPNTDKVYFTVQKFAPDYTLIRTYTSEAYEDVHHLDEDLASMIDITDIFCE